MNAVRHLPSGPRRDSPLVSREAAKPSLLGLGALYSRGEHRLKLSAIVCLDLHGRTLDVCQEAHWSLAGAEAPEWAGERGEGFDHDGAPMASSGGRRSPIISPSGDRGEA